MTDRERSQDEPVREDTGESQTTPAANDPAAEENISIAPHSGENDSAQAPDAAAAVNFEAAADSSGADAALFAPVDPTAGAAAASPIGNDEFAENAPSEPVAADPGVVANLQDASALASVEATPASTDIAGLIVDSNEASPPPSGTSPAARAAQLAAVTEFAPDSAPSAVDPSGDTSAPPSLDDLNLFDFKPPASDISDLVYRRDQQHEASPADSWRQTERSGTFRQLAADRQEHDTGELPDALAEQPHRATAASSGAASQPAPRVMVMVALANVDQLLADELERAAQSMAAVSKQVADSVLNDYIYNLRMQMRAITGP